MKRLNRQNAPAERYPIRVIQFGEGNFLRGFADWIVWKMNRTIGFEAGVAVVQPTPRGRVSALNEQDGLYVLNLQGTEHGRPVDSVELIDVIQTGIDPYRDYEGFLRLAEHADARFIVSNTTEAGIAFDPTCRFDDAPALSFPAKLVQLLHRRYEVCNGDRRKGFIILPCELIARNGDALKWCIDQYIELWQLDDGFRRWVDEACTVCQTLVDRIVPGFPADSIARIAERTGYDDRQAVKAEVYHLWVIEAPEAVAHEFPADKAGLNVHFVADEGPYHARKVTLLNGPHTAMAPVGHLCGLQTVKECMDDPLVGRYVHRVMYDELLHTLDLPMDERMSFADSVSERFANPYMKHLLASILLNSFAKFRTRDLPGLKRLMLRNGPRPDGLIVGLAALLTCYRAQPSEENGHVPADDPAVVALLHRLWADPAPAKVAQGVLGAEELWGENLNRLPGLTERLAHFLQLIDEKGMRGALETLAE